MRRVRNFAIETAAALAALVVLAGAVPVFAIVFFATLDEPRRTR